MPRRFRMRPGLNEVVLPGGGKILSGTLLEGDQYARWCPQFLMELLDSRPVAESAPLLTEPVETPKFEEINKDVRVLEEVSPDSSVSEDTLEPSFDDLRSAQQNRRTRRRR